jgi:hypothetical protein
MKKWHPVLLSMAFIISWAIPVSAADHGVRAAAGNPDDVAVSRGQEDAAWPHAAKEQRPVCDQGERRLHRWRNLRSGW